MNLLVLADLTEATGNATTAHRIAAHLEHAHRVTLVDVTRTDPGSFAGLVTARGIEAVIGVHALLAGPYLRALGKPYALVFGGTELYPRMHGAQEREMTRAVLGARRLIAFSDQNAARAEWKWPAVRGRVDRIPQAASAPAPNELYSLRAALELDPHDVLVLLPASLRSVKDPLHVVDAFHAWTRVEPRVHLAVIGAPLEPGYADDARAILAERPGVSYVAALPRDRLMMAMLEADVVINTSRSEGMSGTLLEAMCIGAPVVARRNAGNEALIAHGKSGLLYDAPGELVGWLRALVASSALRRGLARAGGERVRVEHTLERERDAYLEVARSLGEPAPPAPPKQSAPDELDAALSSAAQIGLDGAERARLAAVVRRVRASAGLRATARSLAGLLEHAPPSVATHEVAKAELEQTLSREDGRAFHLLLALSQVPAAEARHRARDVDPEITRATMAALARMARSSSTFGITLDDLAAAQRLLRGERFGVGALQLELRPFTAPLRVFRHRRSRALAAITLDGRPVDLQSGAVGDEESVPLGPWDSALAPGSIVLDAQLDAPIAAAELSHDARDALALFARLSPALTPVALCADPERTDAAFLRAPSGEAFLLLDDLNAG